MYDSKNAFRFSRTERVFIEIKAKRPIHKFNYLELEQITFNVQIKIYLLQHIIALCYHICRVEIKCPPLERPRNGNMACSKDGRQTCERGHCSVTTECVFTCDAGFDRMGSRRRECRPTGKWTGVNTQCDGNILYSNKHLQ